MKPDFKKLGPKYGKSMKELSSRIQAMEQEEINELEKAGVINFVIDNKDFTIESSDVEILSEDIPGWLVGSEGRITIALDITITDTLRKEGIAREMVNRIQNLRKAKDFEITDRIDIKVSSNKLFDEAITEFNQYISGQVLADSIVIDEGPFEDEIEIDEEKITMSILKIK